jgi:hypothetical protein
MALRTTVEKSEDMFDREAISYNDIFAFRLAMKMYYFKQKHDDSRTHAFLYIITIFLPLK